jgi:hypothetical protein
MYRLVGRQRPTLFLELAQLFGQRLAKGDDLTQVAVDKAARRLVAGE